MHSETTCMSRVVSLAVYVASVIELLICMAYWVEEVVTYLEDNLCQFLFRDLRMVYVTACDKAKSMVVQSRQFLQCDTDRDATTLYYLAVW